MDLHKQVCTLYQARTLKMLGVKQDSSLFNWCCVMPDPTGERFYHDVMYRFGVEETLTELIASAFTVAELGVMLPIEVTTVLTDGNEWTLSISAPLCFDIGVIEWRYKTEAEARAAILIHILENKHLTAYRINSSLSPQQ